MEVLVRLSEAERKGGANVDGVMTVIVIVIVIVIVFIILIILISETYCMRHARRAPCSVRVDAMLDRAWISTPLKASLVLSLRASILGH